MEFVPVFAGRAFDRLSRARAWERDVIDVVGGGVDGLAERHRARILPAVIGAAAERSGIRPFVDAQGIVRGG